MATEYLSLQRFPGDGVTTDFEVNFAGGSGDTQQGTQPYIDVEDIKAYELVPLDGLNPSQRIPRTIVPLGPLSFRVSPAVPAGRFLEIARETEDHYTLVDFKSLQAVSEFDLDLSNRQLLFLTQESSDRSRLAAESASAATVTSELAMLTAEDALQTADEAVSTAENAVSIADGARGQANIATDIANSAVDTATTAVDTADAAVQSADNANTTADNALGVATGIEAIALSAKDTAEGIAGTANEARTTALAASDTADAAYSIAEEALEVATEAGVASFNDRNGIVVPEYGDYTPGMIPTGAEASLEDTLRDIQSEFDQVEVQFNGVDDALGELEQFNSTVVPLDEAQTGTSITPRTWTAQRVWQSITAWWSGIRANDLLLQSSITQVPDAETVQQALEELGSAATFSLRENIKVTVGAGGDFPTINAAILHLSRFTPDLGVTAEVELMSGFVMMEQLLVEGLNLGWITITGVDSETVINEPSLTRGLTAFLSGHKPAFGVANGTLPTIGQLFSFSSRGSTDDFRSGVLAYNTGRVTILEGCGVKNAGYNGIYATDSSKISARGSNASGAGNYGVQSTQASEVSIWDAIVTDAGRNGINASYSSTINAAGADASGAVDNGIYATLGSTINAQNAVASGAGSYGVSAYDGSTINANGVDASGAGVHGIYAARRSTINAGGADASSAVLEGIRVIHGSTINAQGATGTLYQTKNTVTHNGIIFQA